MKTKKLIAAVLLLLLVITTAAPAFAETEGTEWSPAQPIIRAANIAVLMQPELPDPDRQKTADKLLQSLEEISRDCIRHRFTYSNDDTRVTYKGALRSNRRINCAAYVSWAMQEAGLIKGKHVIWLDRKIKGSAEALNMDAVTVLYPDLYTESCRFHPGDICGWKLKSGQHTMVYAGLDKYGHQLWYTAGRDDVSVENYGPKRRISFDHKPVNIVIRIN